MEIYHRNFTKILPNEGQDAARGAHVQPASDMIAPLRHVSCAVAIFKKIRNKWILKLLYFKLLSQHLQNKEAYSVIELSKKKQD